MKTYRGGCLTTFACSSVSWPETLSTSERIVDTDHRITFVVGLRLVLTEDVVAEDPYERWGRINARVSAAARAARAVTRARRPV